MLAGGTSRCSEEDLDRPGAGAVRGGELRDTSAPGVHGLGGGYDAPVKLRLALLPGLAPVLLRGDRGVVPGSCGRWAGVVRLCLRTHCGGRGASS